MNTKSALPKIQAKSKRLAAIRLVLLLSMLNAFSQWGSAQKAVAPIRPAPDKQAPAPLPSNKTGLDKAPASTPSNAITGVKSYQEGGKLYVVLSTTAVLEYKQSMLRDPSRLVIDFPNAVNKVLSPNLALNTGKVKQLRIRQFQDSDPKITRLVFDMEDGPGKPEIVTDSQTVRIAFSNVEGTAKPLADAPTKTASAIAPSLKPAAVTSSPKPAATAPAMPSPVAATALKPAATVPAMPSPVAATAPKSAAIAPAKPSPIAAPPPRSAAVAPANPSPVPAPSAKPPAVSLVPSASAEPRPPKAKVELVELTAVAPPARAKERGTPISKAPLVRLPAATVAMANPAQPAESPAVDLKANALVPPAAQEPAPSPPAPKPAIVAIAPQESRFTGQPLTLDLVDIPLVDFFRLMAEEGGINIVMDPEIRGTISMKVVKVPWDQIFDAALSNNGLDKQVEGNLVRIARKATLQEEAKQREAFKKATLLAADLETRIRRLNYAKAASFIGPLTEQKTVRGTVVVDERTNSLILNDIPNQLDKMLALVDSLDIPQPQVEIEARIVSATRDFARDIGIQFGFVEGNLDRVTVGGPNTFGTIGGYRPSQTPKSAYVGGNPITGRGASEGKSSEAASIGTGVTDQSKGNYNVNLPAGRAFGGMGISIGNIFDTFLLDAAITAGENKGLAKLISQPKVTTANNSPASITQGFRFPVQIIANQTVTVQFQTAALMLTTTPQITYEGNIVLDLKVENNTPDFAKQVNGIPSIRTSESQTRVMVTDGGTTVIGGILIDNESNQEDRVPGLASIPIIGNAFRRTSVSHSTQEVLFFITPRLIK